MDQNPSKNGWLSAFRVIDLSAIGPASRAASVLSDYGAEIVKVLAPRERRGDAIETDPGAYGGGRAMSWLRIDLARAEGRDVFLRLVDTADVVLESYRPGVADRLGVGAAVLRARNPRLVYCSTSGYGRTGPYAGWAGHDLNYVGLTGLLAQSERRGDDGPPVLGATIADAAGGGLQAVVAVLAALLAREHTGVGATLDVSATEGTLWFMALAVDHHLAQGTGFGLMPLISGRYACYSTYAARDRRWLSVAALEPRFWRNLCDAIGLSELADLQLDAARQGEMKQRLAEVFATRDRDEWIARLGPADTCVAPVHAVDEVADDPHLRARGVFVGTGQQRLAPLFAGTARSEVPARDTSGLLRDAGLAPDEIAALIQRGVVQ